MTEKGAKRQGLAESRGAASKQVLMNYGRSVWVSDAEPGPKRISSNGSKTDANLDRHPSL